jgi:hypothetical protein
MQELLFAHSEVLILCELRDNLFYASVSWTVTKPAVHFLMVLITYKLRDQLFYDSWFWMDVNLPINSSRPPGFLRLQTLWPAVQCPMGLIIFRTLWSALSSKMTQINCKLCFVLNHSDWLRNLCLAVPCIVFRLVVDLVTSGSCVMVSDWSMVPYSVICYFRSYDPDRSHAPPICSVRFHILWSIIPYPMNLIGWVPRPLALIGYKLCDSLYFVIPQMSSRKPWSQWVIWQTTATTWAHWPLHPAQRWVQQSNTVMMSTEVD